MSGAGEIVADDHAPGIHTVGIGEDRGRVHEIQGRVDTIGEHETDRGDIVGFYMDSGNRFHGPSRYGVVSLRAMAYLMVGRASHSMAPRSRNNAIVLRTCQPEPL